MKEGLSYLSIISGFTRHLFCEKWTSENRESAIIFVIFARTIWSIDYVTIVKHILSMCYDQKACQRSQNEESSNHSFFLSFVYFFITCPHTREQYKFDFQCYFKVRALKYWLLPKITDFIAKILKKVIWIKSRSWRTMSNTLTYYL